MANRVDDFAGREKQGSQRTPQTGSIPGFEGYDPNKAEGVFDEKDIANTLGSVGRVAKGKLSSYNLVSGAAQTNFRNSITPSGSVNEDGQLEFASANFDAMDDPNVQAAAKDIGLSEAGARGTAGLFLAPLLLMDAGYRATNTVVGGTYMLGVDNVGMPTNLLAGASGINNGSNINPNFDDGYQWSDIGDTYKMMWGQEEAVIGRDGKPVMDAEGNEVSQLNAITAGQAITIGTGVSWLNAYDLVTSGDTRGDVDKSIEEDNVGKLADPNNTRDLLDWKWGLHTEFDIGNLKQRDSALGQGAGRWISGAADAAVLWWAAPEVVGLKLAGKAARSLTVRSVGDLSDVNKLNESLRMHKDFLNGAQGGKRTAVGQLVESLAKMNTERIGRHKIATTSTDGALVARTFGPAKTFDDAALRLRAISGDRKAIAQLMNEDIVVADALSLNVEALQRTARELGMLEESAGVVARANMTVGGTPTLNFVGELTVKRMNQQIDLIRAEAGHAEKVLSAAIKENEHLATALAGISKEAGLPNALTLRNLQISKLSFGPSSAARMEKQAAKAVSKQNGDNLWFVKSFKTGGKFGRQVRVWNAGLDYMKTHRMKGLVDLNDTNDVIAELDGIIQTLPMMRRLAKKFQGEAFLPGTGQLVSDFRREIYSRMNAAISSTERMVVFEDFERRMWNALAFEYGISEQAAKNMITKYSGMRQAVVEQVRQKGLISQDGEIHVLKDMQSILAEKMPAVDFHFIENIFRLDRGSGLQKAKGWSDIRGSRTAANIDAIWRPLVLLRLGYTTRNVLEGNLRELAAYKSVAIFSERGMGTTAIESSLAWRSGRGFARGANRIALMRKGRLKKKKREVERAQGIATATQREVNEAVKLRDGVSAQVDEVWSKADKDARSTLTEEFKATTSNRTSVTMEEVNTEATGEFTALADEADELIMPSRYVRPLFGGGSKRSNYAAGFETPQEGQVRVAMQDSTAIGGVKNQKLAGELADENPLSPYSPDGVLAGDGTEEAIEANIRNWLSSKEAAQWDELIARANQQQFGQAELDMYNALVSKASRRSVYKGMKDGDVVVRTIDPKNGTYEIVHDFKNITIDDLNNDLIGIIKKEQLNKVEYVRANVFGSSIDLRASQMKLSRGESDRPSGLVETESLNGPQPWDEADKVWTPRLSDPGWEYMDQLARDLGLNYWSRSSENFLSGSGKEGFLESLYEIERVLKMALDDPALAASLKLKMLVNQMPPHMQRWFEKTGLLVNNKELKRLANKAKKAEDKSVNGPKARDEEVNAFRENLRMKYWQDENGKTLTPEEFSKLIPSITDDLADLVFHGGNRIKGDKLDIDPIFTEENIKNLVGIGFYTTRDPGMGVTYIFNRADQVTGENTLYTAVLPKGGEKRFVDLDEPMEVMPGPNGTTPEQLMDTDQWLQDTFYNMHLNYDEKGIPSLIDDLDAEVDFMWSEVVADVEAKYQRQLNPTDPTKEPRTHGLNVDDYRQGMERHFMKLQRESVGEEITSEETALELSFVAQMIWVDVMREQGAVGVKHIGGRTMRSSTRDHDVFVWYEVPEIKPVSEITQDFYQLEKMRVQANELAASDLGNAHKARQNLNEFERYQGLKPGALDAANMTDRDKSMLVKYMSEHGAGRVVLDDSLAPSGKTVITSPDMMAVSTDQAEAAMPSGMIGKDFVDNTLPQLEREAMVRQPSVWKASQVEDDILLPLLGNDPELLSVVRGQVKGTPEQNARLATVLESEGYSHIQIGEFGSGSSKFANSAELAANKKTGLAYGALLNESELVQTRNQILGNNPKWEELHSEYESMSTGLAEIQGRLDTQILDAKKATDALAKRLGKRGKGAAVKGGAGTGTERFVGDFNEFETLGPLNVNSQGSMWSEATSSSNTNLANLYGYTDYAMMSLRKTSQLTVKEPGEEGYFLAMAEQLNKYHRNDMVSKMIIRGSDDEEILSELMGTEIGRLYVRDIHAFGALKGLVDSKQLTEDARNEMIDVILEKRNTLKELMPDDDVARHLIDGEVTPDFLMTRMGWRSDLPNISDGALIDNNRGALKNFLGKAMHTIGALPEDALVRHPFYRSRWREEMQRQADLYADQGLKDFTDVQINAMDRVAKRYALQQVNESLYTIQRLSTPAHVFKFVIPFFPAWASAMRFWMLQVPARHPEAIARYAMLYNAPESAGWVYDMDGNKVQGEDNFRSRITNKLFGGAEGKIVIQFNTKEARDKMAKLTGGMTQFAVPTGSMDFMLQGENPFIPGLHPWLVVPLTWIASRKPDIATAFETGNLKEIPFFGDFTSDEVNEWFMEKEITKPLYKSAIPFGRPTQEKGILDVVTETFAPGTIDKLVTLTRGMSSVSFANSAKEIYRTDMTDHDLNDNPDKGAAPEFTDAINKAETFWWFRAFTSAVMPFSVQAASPYQFYINEARRMDREIYDAGGTYEEASSAFLKAYGTEFFRYHGSLSGGSSGMGANVGEFKEFERDPRLMADLADIGDDASFITMATRPFQDAMNEDGFDVAVYAWQQGRKIDGTTGKYIRGGEQDESPEKRSNKELGWIKYNKMVEQLEALAAEEGTTLAKSDILSSAKVMLAKQIGAEQTDWWDAYNDPTTGRWIQSNRALESMYDSGYFETHKNHPTVGTYVNAMLQYRSLRQAVSDVLAQRKMEGGSSNISAKSNADVALAWEGMMTDLKDSDETGNFRNTYERFFSSDTLEPIPSLESANG